MTYQDYDNEIFDLQCEIVDIEKQIALYSDRPRTPEWPAQVAAALKLKQLQVADLTRRRDLLKGFETIEKSFMESARTLLDPGLFQRLLCDAKERMSL